MQSAPRCAFKGQLCPDHHHSPTCLCMFVLVNTSGWFNGSIGTAEGILRFLTSLKTTDPSIYAALKLTQASPLVKPCCRGQCSAQGDGVSLIALEYPSSSSVIESALQKRKRGIECLSISRSLFRNADSMTLDFISEQWGQREEVKKLKWSLIELEEFVIYLWECVIIFNN